MPPYGGFYMPPNRTLRYNIPVPLNVTYTTVDCIIRVFDCSIRVCRSFGSQLVGTSVRILPNPLSLHSKWRRTDKIHVTLHKGDTPPANSIYSPCPESLLLSLIATMSDNGLSNTQETRKKSLAHHRKRR